MANINVSLPEDGTTADVSDYNTPITTIVNEINGNLDNSNIDASAAIAGSKLADDSIPPAKLEAVQRQNITTDTTIVGPKIQTGWGYIQGNGSSDNMAQSVTFPEAFSGNPIVIVSGSGQSTSVPTDVGDLTATSKGYGQGEDISTTGFTAAILSRDNTNLASSVYYGYVWIAIGPA